MVYPKNAVHACVGAILFSALLSTPASAQQSLDIGNTTLAGFAAGTVDVSMTTTAPTQGFVIAVGYNTLELSVVAIEASPAVLGTPAELVAGNVYDASGGATLGVVLDANAPFMNQTIPAGTTVIAHLDVMADILLPPLGTGICPLTFVDGAFGSPTLDNIIVQGGLSLGAGTIDLNDGFVEKFGGFSDEVSIQGATVPAGQTACAEIVLANQTNAVQGFVLAIQHDPNLVLQEIQLGTASAGAEFFVGSVLNAEQGGTLGVVMDFNPPFAGQVIAPGGNNHIASFCYSCVSHPVDDGDPMTDDSTVHALDFVDGVLGMPALDNVLVVAGLSLSFNQTSGAMKCAAVPLEDTAFACGKLDSEGNLDTGCLTGGPDDTVELCFFWQDPTDNVAAFQIAVCWDNPQWFTVCGNPCFDISGTIVEAVGAEFINCSIDNTNGDMVIGILLDFLPPFDRQTVPPTADWLKVGSVDFCIDAATPCDESTQVSFCETDGVGSVQIGNLVTTWREIPENSGNFILTDIQDFATFGCCIELDVERLFIRGNCNNDPQNKVTISDAATVLAYQFQGVPVGCRDACDVNDDGKINLADAVFLLNYLFKSGPPHNSPEPPSPFPTQGPDSTIDDPSGFHAELDCVDGRDPCAP